MQTEIRDAEMVEISNAEMVELIVSSLATQDNSCITLILSFPKCYLYNPKC